MNIALTLHVDHSIFANGQLQNIIMFADLIKNLGHSPFFIVNRKSLNGILRPSLFKFPLLTQDELYFNDLSIDYFISVAWSPSVDYMRQLKKRKGPIQRVALHYGNRMFCDLDMPIRDNNYLPIEHREVDQVWTSPHFTNSIPYYKDYYNIEKVYVAPYIWSPCFMELFEKELNEKDLSAHYSSLKPKNIGVFEPNLTVYKCTTIPAMICASTLRDRPQLFNKIIFSSVKQYMKKSPFYKCYFKETLQLPPDRFETHGRLNTIEALASKCCYMVSHQMNVDLNYLYLEALYFNVPLIHNSVALKEYGYYYHQHDTNAGRLQLINALENHDNNLEEYKQNSQKALSTYSPDNPVSQAAYKKLFI